MIIQKEIMLQPKRRGYHIITGEILREVGELPEAGLMNLFIKHTSAALTINENCDPAVRQDMEMIGNHLVKDGDPRYVHDMEGDDDMPAHFKSSMMGVSLTIPITNGHLNMGTWQGIYLCEFRNCGGSRKITVTIYA